MFRKLSLSQPNLQVDVSISGLAVHTEACLMNLLNTFTAPWVSLAPDKELLGKKAVIKPNPCKAKF